jgi:hypothetical protein
VIIAKCRTYHAISAGQSLLRMPDGKSVFKIYYLSIVGRDKPELFEWDSNPHTRAEFEKIFLSGKYEGVGFVTVFPHIAKIFRFSPHAETVLDIREFDTFDMLPKDLSRGDNTHEFACYAESIIAADEHDAWAKAATVEDYMAFRCEKTDFPVMSHVKLADYWERG